MILQLSTNYKLIMDDSQPTPKNEMKTSEDIVNALAQTSENGQEQNKTKVKENRDLKTKERKPILSQKAKQDLDRIFMM